MKKENEKESTKTNAEDSTEKSEKETSEEGEDTSLKWGFGFDKTEKKETNSEEKETEEEETPSEVELMRQELKAIKTQVQIDNDLKSLSKKYNGKEGFPEVDKGKIISFLEGDFNKVPPMELGYIMANFSDILKARDAMGAKKVEEKYSPEAVASQKQEVNDKKIQDKFVNLGEKLRKRFGVQKKED